MSQRRHESEKLTGSYVLAAVIWLAAIVVGGFADCGPASHDGQCGMSTVFAGLTGLAIAVILVGAASIMAFRQQRRRIVAGAVAFAVGIAILAVGDAAAWVRAGQPSGEIMTRALAQAALLAFLGGPYIYAAIVVAGSAAQHRVGRRGAVGRVWSAGIGIAAGLALGCLVPPLFASGLGGRAAVFTYGAAIGGSVGYIFCRIAFPPVEERSAIRAT